MKLRLSIRQHVAWLTLVPLLLMAAILESFFLYNQFADMDRDLLARGQLIARQLAASSEYGMFSSNRTFLTGVAKSAMQEVDVKAIVMLNAAAEKLVAEGEVTPQVLSLFLPATSEARIFDDGTTLRIYQPILATQIALDEADAGTAPRLMGSILMELSWQRTHTMKSRLLWFTIAATAAFLLVTLFLVSLANRPIIKSIRGLSQAVAEIGAGDLNLRVMEHSRVSELFALGNGINRMVSDLQQEHAVLDAAHQQLDQINQNLEELVKERTRDLSAILERVRSQQKELQESETRWRTIIETEPECVAIVDAHGCLVQMNPAGLVMFGADSMEQISGHKVVDVIVPEYRAAYAEMQQKVLAGEPMRMEFEIVGFKGIRRWMEIHAVAIRDKGKTLQLAVTRDITERKQQEERRLAKERELRSTLVREVHHRIKNNLQSVAGLLQRELGKFLELDPRLETAISQINVIAVVHGLQGIDPNEAIRLPAVVESICKTVSMLTQAPVALNTGEESATLPQLEITSEEAVSLALVLNELILNAVKHSSPGATAPTVSLRNLDCCVELVIRNAMQGVPGFDIATGKGLGTGLSLVRSLLPEQGARLTYNLDQEGFMVTRLELSSPVIFTNHQAATTGS